MKKLLSILLVLFVLCGCGGSKLFYKTTEQPLIQNLGSELPYYIDVYSDDKFNSTGIDDEQTIKTIVDLIKKIEIVEEVDTIQDNGIYINLYVDENVDNIEIHGDVVYVYKDEMGSFYKATNTQELIDYCNSLIEDIGMPLVIDYTKVFEKDGLSFSQASPEIEDDGDIYLDMQVENNSDKSIEFTINPTVNGIDIHGYQRLGVEANSSVGYLVQIPSSLLKEYGVVNIGKLDYTISVYEFDYETFETIGYLYTSDVISPALGLSYDFVLTKENVVYSDNGLDICAKFVDGSINTNVYLYLESVNDLDDVHIKAVTLNGERQDYYDEFADIKIENHQKLALIPLYNYEINEETYETTLVDIESLVFNTEINGVATDIVIK